MRSTTAALLIAALGAGTACRPQAGAAMSRTDSATVTERAEHLAQVLAQPDSSATKGAPIAKWILGADLLEISGIALTRDGRLLGHADEGGRVFEIDFRTGRMGGHFDLGKDPVVADFEGITSVGDTLYLLVSNGTLYEFQAGPNGSRVEYTKHDTGLKDACEFEGVAFDSTISSLLLACKNVRTKSPLQDSLVIYRWKLPGGSEPQPSRLTLPLAQITGPNGWKGLHPSDIAVDPTSGNYVLVAADESALIEITPAGQLVFARPLGPGLDHAEGVAITKDSILIISTEGRPKLPSAVTLFRWP